MKRKLLLTAACLLLVLLSACQAKSTTETCWDAAKKAGGLEDYVKEQSDAIDVEALKQEAQAGDLSQQFKATALLCSLEYQQAKASDSSTARFLFDYPVSGQFAADFLNQVNTDADGFWASMEGAFSPYDCYLPILAAARDLDSQTLAKLLDAPSDKSKFLDAVKKWVDANPGKLTDIGDTLLASGYFDGKSLTDIRSAYCSLSDNSFKVRVDTAEDAFQYTAYVRDKLMPAVATETNRGVLMSISDVTGESYYEDPVMVTITGSGPSLQEPGDGTPDPIELEGKTVAAFYRIANTEEFPDDLPALQLMGGFLINLSAEEAPASLAGADYYLVLTAHFEKGDFYQTAGGSNTKIQQVDSLTSVDLYDAATGAFLRHLGNVRETAPDSVVASYDDTSLRYPVTTSADVLAYMYHHVNDPDAYISLVDLTPVNGSVVDADTPVTFGGWEITYHSAQIVKEFTSGMYIYSAHDGKQFVKAALTITNRNLEKDTFLPMIYYIGQDPIVQVADSSKQNLYDCVNAITYSACLNNTTLEPGESEDGDLLFEIPDELAQSGEPLYIAVSLDKQIVYYPLG